MKKSLTRLPRAVLFDLDGTLAHTAPDLVGATNMVCIQEGVTPAAYDLLAPHASAGTAALLNAALGITPDSREFERLKSQFLAHYEAHIADETRLYSGIAKLIAFLEDHCILWGIVTNKPSKYTNLLIPEIGLFKAACVISGDTTPYSKPHPEPLLEAARRLNLKAQDCWYVGDDLRDMKAAQAAGMFSIAANWGYGENIGAWPADIVLDSADKLHALIAESLEQQDTLQQSPAC